MQDKKQMIGFGVIWIFLCCYFMQLFNFPNALTILMGGSICLVLLIRQKKFRLDLGTILLGIAIASYFIILYGKRAFTMSLPYVGVLMYVLAHYLSFEINNRKDDERIYIYLILAIVVGYSVHGILNSYLFLDGQLQNGSVRIWMDIWAQWYMPGTWQVVFFLPVLAFVFPAVAYFGKRKWINILVFVTALFFVYISLESKSRISLLVLLLVFGAQLLLYTILEKQQTKRIILNKKNQIVIGAFFVSVLVLFFSVKDSSFMISFRDMMGRQGGIFHNVRFQIQREALKQIFVYPFGGYQMELLGYAHSHNTWLDIADAAGVIPFFAFVAYTLYTIYELIIWLIKKEVSTERKLMTAGVYGAFFLFYTVERGLGGSMHYMTPWFFITGLIHGELSIIKNKQRANI